MSSLRLPLGTRRRRACRTARARSLQGVGAAVALLGVASLSLLNPVAAEADAGLRLTPGHSASSTVRSSMLDGSARGRFVVPDSGTRTVYLGFQFRSPSPAQGYRVKGRILPDGTVWVGTSRVSGGTETLLSSAPVGIKVSSGQRLDVEGSVSGTNPVKLAVRAWVDGSTKPDWQQQTVDSSAAQVKDDGPTRSWAYLSSAATSTTTMALDEVTVTPEAVAVATGTGTGKPSASTTGVPAGTALTQHYGDITVTKDGTVLDRMDIHGFVVVRAKNVKITNSVVRGGRAQGFDTGLITDYGYDNLLISDVTVEPEYPSVYFDGIKGWDYTARRVHVTGNVDSVKIQGDNVVVQDSLLENTTYFASDPSQHGGPTHNDNIQILNGRNLRITGNTIRGATNFAILGAANKGDTPNLVVDGNWLDGGHCTVKLQELNGWNENASVTNNKFGPNRLVKSCAFQATPSVNLTNSSGNVFESDGSPVIPLRVDS